MCKRFCFIFFAFLLVGGFAFGGGQQGDSGKSDQSIEIEMSAPGTFPIVQEPVEMTAMIPSHGMVEDFNTNEFSKWLQEKTGVDMYYEVIPEANIAEKLNITLASGDYPDMFLSMGITPTQEVLFGAQDVFVALNPYIQEYGVEYKRLMKELPQVEEVMRRSGDKIYSIPKVNLCYHCLYSQKFWIYKPWLDVVGMDLPQTTEEFRAVLKAFREQDPNGNGKADDIPLVGGTTGWHTNLDGFLMSAFIYNDSEERMIVENGKIDVVYNKPQWKKGLQYMKSLYDEGLIAPESFTQDVNQFRQMLRDPEKVVVGVAACGAIRGMCGADNYIWRDYVTVPALSGPDGYRRAFWDAFGGITGDAWITSSCDYPAVAYRWGDLHLSEESTMRSVHGRPGIEWREATPEDGVGLNGLPAETFRILVLGEIHNAHWNQRGPSVRTFNTRQRWAIAPSQPGHEKILYEETKKNYAPYAQPMENQIPPLVFTDIQAEELGDRQTVIEEYVREMIARFVTGDVDLDSGWDSYLKELEAMGVQRLIDIYQAAYDAS